MHARRIALGTILMLTVAVGATIWTAHVMAAVPNQQNQQNQQNQGPTTSVTIIDARPASPSGIMVDARGVLEKRVYADPTREMYKERVTAAKASLPREVTALSRMRKVSLKHLEQVLSDHHGALDDTMRYLAGLLRVKYVLFYPDSKDIVLAGPAEGWMADPSGRVVGLTTGRPVVQLQDLVVALRAFAPGVKGPNIIGCSIDPTQEGLAAMQQYLRQVGANIVPDQTQSIVDGLRSSLGLQQVTINGVSPKTNFARILVEADYRMKLIGIGLEEPPVRMVSFIQKVNPAQVSRNALFRWYFVPDYQCLRCSEDGLAMELVGDGVKLIGEDELIASGGQRAASTTRGNRASQEFVASFTRKYPELAERSPVYAELRNVIDLAVIAAYIQEQDLYRKADWSMPMLGSEQALAVELFNAPKMVESAVAAVWKGSRLTTPIGGGVQIEPRLALTKDNRLEDEKGAVAKVREEVKIKLAPGQWWWD